MKALTALATLSCGAAMALFLAAPAAQAHPFALSGFDAWAGASDLRFDFTLDVPAVLAVLDRVHPQRPTTDPAAIRAERALVFAYLTAHFHVSNDGRSCPLSPPGELEIAVSTAKVVLQLHFACPHALGQLTIESTIFNELSPAPQILGTFHHQRALEHYFFSGGLRVANIPVPALRQALPADIDNTRPFAMVPPPPDAYAADLARAAGARFGFFASICKGLCHMLGGLDRVLFVIALMMAVGTRRRSLLTLGSFTLGHSLGLALGGLALVVAAPDLIRPLVALSIIYVALENALRAERPSRPLVIAAFGLVHGLGFGAVVRGWGLPAGQRALALLGFNLGLDLGQLLIALPILALGPIAAGLRGRAGAAGLTARPAGLAVNAIVAVIACVWLATTTTSR